MFSEQQNSIHQAENVLFPLIAVLGFLCNAFVVMVIIITERSRSHRTVANTFVMNLAIADILFLVALPFYTPSLHETGFAFSGAMCKLLEALKHISYHSSILFLTGMSVDRYMAIVHSLRSLEFRTQRNARIACAVLWLTSIITTLPVIIFSKLEVWTDGNTTVGNCVQLFPGHEESQPTFANVDELLQSINTGGLGGAFEFSGDYDYNENPNETHSTGTDKDYDLGELLFNNSAKQIGDSDYVSPANVSDKICVGYLQNKNSRSFWAWQYFTFVGFFIIPIVVIMFCYFKIWQATAIRKVRSQKAEGNPEQQMLQGLPGSPKQDWKQIQSKVTVMVAVLVSAFILSWLPFQVWIMIIIPPGVKVTSSHHCDIINVVVAILAWSNSLVNPILYSITSENFRKRAMTTLFYLRYGYRRTIRMSVTRTSRTGIGMRTEKTDLGVTSMQLGSPSPKNDRRNNDTQYSPPPTPIDAAAPGNARF